MKHPIFAVLAAGALTIFSPMAMAAQPSDSGCLQVFNLRGWKVVDDRTLIIEDWQHHPYKMSLQGGCTGLKFSLGLRFQPYSTSRLSCLSHGDSVFVPPGGGLPSQRCYVNAVQPYTPEMQHADAVAKAMDKPH